MHNTADVHSLNFAAHYTPFHPETPPSSWAVVSQRVHSPLYSHPHEYLLQYLSNTLSGGGKQTHSYPFVEQSNASILWTAPRPSSRSLGVSLYDLHTIHGSAAVTSVLLSAAYALFSVFGGQWNALTWFPRPYVLIVRLIHRSCRALLRTIRASRH